MVVPPERMAVTMFINVITGQKKPMAVSASGPMRLPAKAPSIMVFKLATFQCLQCDKNIMENIKGKEYNQDKNNSGLWFA